MTTGGWQGGDQGGWNPDPYGQQQQPQYGPAYDPYGQYQQQDPYGATAYQPYPPFGEPPPPPKKSRLPIILSLVAIVAIVGGVIAIVLLNRDSNPQPAANTGPSSSEKPATPTKLPGTSRRPPSSGANPPKPGGGLTIEFADGSGSYQVPADWKKTAEKRDSGLADLQFGDGAEVGTYTCGGSNYFRGFSASNQVQSKSGAELDVSKVATDFANSFSTKYYANPKIDLPEPQQTNVGNKKVAIVTAKLTIQPTKPDCEATSGEVAVLAVGIENAGKVESVRVVVVVNDLQGGPADPKPLPDPLAEDILDSVSVK